MTLPGIGSTVRTTLGDQMVDVKVTRQNQQMLEDGDLTNDLAQIRQSVNDGADLSIADVRANFDVNQAQHIFNVASGVQPLAYNPGGLSVGDRNNLTAIINSKPYITAATGASPAPAAMSTFLNNQTITERTGVIAELANETGMMHVRDELNTALAARPAGSALSYSQLISTLGTAPTANVMRQMGGDTPANRQALADRIMTHPDMSLGQKHALLNKLGFTNTTTNDTNIAAAMQPIHDRIQVEAERIFTQLGGTGTMPETIAMASGDGTGTRGLTGQQNVAIGLMHYGNVTSAAPNAGDIALSTVGGLATASETFRPTSHTKPVSFHFSATGADFTAATPGFAGNSSMSIQHAGKTYTFDITRTGNNTTIAPAAGTTLPAGVRLDPSGRTLTFPPTSQPFTLTQTSASANAGLDEIFTSVSVSNASSSNGNINMNLNGVFAPDRFGITFNQLSQDQRQQLTDLAAYLKQNPTQTLSVEATGRGPTWWDGSRPAEMSGYGQTEATGTTRTQLLGLRSTDVSSNMAAGRLNVASTTDPVESNLNSRLSANGQAAFNQFTTSHPGLTNNDILSGCRAFATLEMMQAKFTELGVPQQILDANTVVQLANGQSMTYPEFQAISQP